ncbi:MAG: hypothetical protein QY309_05320 [Cyclobacteriaceae bacterium]|nr:MAG: hypothetical protein QY309_05320 [Cyclobacteriaceae bacterium]
MNLEIDVLIIYSDKDNETAGGQSGWVTQFKKFLDLMLTQVLGSKPNILLKSEYDNMVSPKLDNAATLVSILSPDFIQSGQCLDNLEAFYQAAEASGKNHNRVFKVFKNPLSVQEQPPRLRELIGYEMYQLDSETGEVREYTDYFSSEAERQYWMKMVDLAYDIYDTLLQLKGTEAKGEVKNIYKRKTIYLAETGHDLSVQRNIIKRELQRHGYIVTPTQTLPGNIHDIEKMVKRDLEEASLSIHLIGAAYGEIPDGSDRSIVDLQNRFAAEKSQRVGKEHFTRLIWISPVLINASERQRSFIDNLKRDTDAQEGAEILQTPLEDFKNIMREELLEADEKKALEETGGKSVYLVHDRVDHQEVKPIIEAIEKNGYKVLMPAFEGELLDLRQKHINNLRNFDTAIIYKGKVNDQWVRMKVLDLLKAPGFGRKKPIKGKAVLTSINSGLNLDAFKNQNLRVVQADPRDVADKIKSLLEEFNN